MLAGCRQGTIESSSTLCCIKGAMLITDLCFLTYWIATVFGAVSVGPDLVIRQWNWSFLGLDLTAIAFGLSGLVIGRRDAAAALPVITVSLSLTSAAGLMALNFYLVSGDYDPRWWIPNLWLFAFPAFALVSLLRSPHTGRTRRNSRLAPKWCGQRGRERHVGMTADNHAVEGASSHLRWETGAMGNCVCSGISLIATKFR